VGVSARSDVAPPRWECTSGPQNSFVSRKRLLQQYRRKPDVRAQPACLRANSDRSRDRKITFNANSESR
jgi:hypothetical protein